MQLTSIILMPLYLWATESTLKKQYSSGNGLHYAIHGSTAAELLVSRADSGKVTTQIAKNYALSEFEKYRVVQDRLFLSDFDKLLGEIGGEIQ